MQHELDKLLVPVLADVLDEAVGRKLLAEPVRRQAVLGKGKVEERHDGSAGRLADLLLLLNEVGAADEADGALLSQVVQESENLG